MIKNLKKAFTIIELVIVIAVIAILAAVMIPTYSSLVDKANQSADIQAVKQMNTILATYVDGSVSNISEAIVALDKDNIDLEDYKPLQKDHYFYFYMDGKTPKVVYMDKSDNVIYPEKANINGAKLMSLSGDVPVEEIDVSGNSFTISNDEGKSNAGAKLAYLIESKKDTNEDVTITLSGNVDLRGAAVDFGKTTSNITIKGDENVETTLSGLRADDNSVSPTTGEFAGHEYGFGIFGEIASGTVTLSNIIISGVNVGNIGDNYYGDMHACSANTVGLVAGYIDKGATVNLTNVTFKDCVVNGYQKVGGVAGRLDGTLNMTDVKFENTIVNGYVEVAKIAGIVGNPTDIEDKYKANLTFNDRCEFDGITVKGLVDDDRNNTISKSQIDENILMGDSSNTLVLFVNKLYAGATCDFAWYSCTSNTSVTIETITYSLNDWVNSTSNNIEKGVPTNK